MFKDFNFIHIELKIVMGHERPQHPKITQNGSLTMLCLYNVVHGNCPTQGGRRTTIAYPQVGNTRQLPSLKWMTHANRTTIPVANDDGHPMHNLSIESTLRCALTFKVLKNPWFIPQHLIMVYHLYGSPNGHFRIRHSGVKTQGVIHNFPYII